MLSAGNRLACSHSHDMTKTRRNRMILRRRKLLHLGACAAALPALSRIGYGQTYPSRPVRIIVPFAAS